MNAKHFIGALSIGVATALAGVFVPGPVATRGTEPPALSPNARGRIASKVPLAIEWDRRRDRDFLTELDPRTLRTGRRVLLGEQGQQALALSPDREHLLAVGRRGAFTVIDIDSMTRRARFRADDTGWAVAVRWVAPDRAVVLRANPWTTSVAVVDPVEGRTVRRTSFEGTPIRVRRAFGGFVVLTQDVAKSGEKLPASLAVVEATGAVRRVTLERIGAGFIAGDRHPFGRSLTPALATRGGRAIVVGTEGTIADVDLRFLTVSYPRPPRSLLDNVTAALLPRAAAKFSEGVSLWARWIDDRVVALTGRRMDVRGDGDEMRMQGRCLPIRLLDTHDWSLSDFTGSGNGLEVTDGAVITFDRCADDEEPGGIVAYDGDGNVLWRALERKNVSGVTLRGGFAFVRHGYDRVLRSVVLLRNGRVLTTRESFASVLPY